MPPTRPLPTRPLRDEAEARRREADRLVADQAAADQRAAEQLAADQAAAAAAEREAAGPTDQQVGERAEHAAHASSLLTELNREAPAAAPVAADPEPAPAPEPEPAPDHVDDGPAPMVARDQADTAMLLRELSSLGFGADDGPSAPSAPAAPRATPHHDAKKKRKGIFGRG